MSANPIVPGPTTRLVRANLLRARKVRRWTHQEVCDRLADAGRPMWPSVLSKIERGERRIDVDDLVTFAVVFGIEPAALLATAPECLACHGAPPTGFACLSCGTEAGS